MTATASEVPLQVLFVHGMGRTPLSGARMLRRLRARGLATETFGYLVACEDFETIRDRLVRRLSALGRRGEYVLIGHSLGGVLLRAALCRLPAQVRPPRTLFLLGSPVQPARLARRLGRWRLFRLLTGDCGRLLGSAERMAELGPAVVPTVVIAGTTGLRGRWSPFGQELNDGVVALAETAAPWAAEQLREPVLHTLLPASRRVTARIIERLPTHPAAAGD